MNTDNSVQETEQITLQAFIRSIKYNVWLFEKQWLNNHSEEPEEWPLKLSIGSWIEQINLWAQQQDVEVVNEL